MYKPTRKSLSDSNGTLLEVDPTCGIGSEGNGDNGRDDVNNEDDDDGVVEEGGGGIDMVLALWVALPLLVLFHLFDPASKRRISVSNAKNTEGMDVHLPQSCSIASNNVLLLLEDLRRVIDSRCVLLASDLLSNRPIANAI